MVLVSLALALPTTILLFYIYNALCFAFCVPPEICRDIRPLVRFMSLILFLLVAMFSYKKHEIFFCVALLSFFMFSLFFLLDIEKEVRLSSEFEQRFLPQAGFDDSTTARPDSEQRPLERSAAGRGAFE